MNSKVLLILIVAGLAYGGFIWAHKVLDQRTQIVDVPSEDAWDASAHVAALMREGHSIAPRLRAGLEEQGKEAEAFLALLPAEDEDWMSVTRQLEAEGALKNDGGLRVVLPRGVQSSTPRVGQVRRDGLGSAWIAVEEKDADGVFQEIQGFKAAVNVRFDFPESLVFDMAREYRIKASTQKGQAPFVTSEFSFLRPVDRVRLKKAMSTLKLHVHEVRARVFMQACVAMSMGMNDDACALLFERLPKQAGEVEEIGLIERCLYLAHLRGYHVNVTETLKLLKNLR